MIYVIRGKYDTSIGYFNIGHSVEFTVKEFATAFDDSVDSFEAMVEEHMVGVIGPEFKLEKIKLYGIDELVNL